MKVLIFATLIILTSFKALASDYQVIFCETCSSDSSFESYARYLGDGDYVIVNMNDVSAQRWMVKDERFETLAVKKALPEGVQYDLDTYENLRDEFDNLDSSTNSIPIENYSKADLNYSISLGVSSKTPNGCGTGWNAPLIVDYPFEEACNSHDICYSGFSSKGQCDLDFYLDMLKTVDQYVEDLQPKTIVGAVLFQALFQNKANNFYLGVVLLGDDAFCDSTQSTSTATGALCGFDTPSVPRGGLLGTINEEYSGSTSASSDVTIHSNCELWQFPDGNGGHYNLARNCYWSIAP